MGSEMLEKSYYKNNFQQALSKQKDAVTATGLYPWSSAIQYFI